jgi:hypothetical protein
MNKIKLLELISDKCDIHFHNFETTNDTVIADSHFLQFVCHDDKIVINDKTVLPGHLMKSIIDDYLPISLRYSEVNFEEKLIELVEIVHDKLFYAEYNENHEE